MAHPAPPVSRCSCPGGICPRAAPPRCLPSSSPTSHPDLPQPDPPEQLLSPRAPSWEKHSEQRVWACVFPQMWKGYLQRKNTRHDRQAEMVFIGMVSPPLATGRGPGCHCTDTLLCPSPRAQPCTASTAHTPATQDCGGHDGGVQASARGLRGPQGLAEEGQESHSQHIPPTLLNQSP